MIYLASPYTHPDPHVMETRYLCAARFCASAAKDGQVIYSPIVHWHEVAKIWSMPKDHKFWLAMDLEMLRLSFAMWILRIDGWDLSEGIKAEIVFAENNAIPVVYV